MRPELYRICKDIGCPRGQKATPSQSSQLPLKGRELLTGPAPLLSHGGVARDQDDTGFGDCDAGVGS